MKKTASSTLTPWTLGQWLISLALLAGIAATAAADVEPTALLASTIGAPRVPPGSDRSVHLEYDLQITNVFTVPVTLTFVEVTTPDGKSLPRLSGDALAAVTEPLLGTSPAKTGLQVPISGSVAVVVDVAVPAARVPKHLAHRIAYDVPADAPAIAMIGSRLIAGPTLAVDLRPPLVIAPPLRGDGWLSLQGCCKPNGHRSLRYALDGQRIVKAETYAVDWVQLKAGAFFSGDGSQVEQYPGFGAEVVSATGGTVVLVRDGMPEERPNEAPLNVKKPIDYAGNQVVVQFAPGLWAVYAHLQTGSVGVRVGERVTVGQPLGRLGNSGNTTAPHLHFVITDNPVFVTASSEPFVLDRYTLAGVVTPEAMQAAFGGATPQPIAVSGPRQAQVRTHPLVMSVADFPAPAVRK